MRPIYLSIVVCCLLARPLFAQSSTNYTFKEKHSVDGIGKFYQGREIAHVMGHEGAEWLERPERQDEERPDLLMASLKLHPGDKVADIGCGTGYYSWRMAKVIGKTGRAYGVDIQQEMLDLFVKNMTDHQTTNFQTVLGSITNANLPAKSIDLVLMVDVYHEFDHPYEMMDSICRALKPGGRVVWVEYRKEDPKVPIKLLHKMSEAQVRKEAALLPLEWVETTETLPWQHVIVFKRKKD